MFGKFGFYPWPPFRKITRLTRPHQITKSSTACPLRRCLRLGLGLGLLFRRRVLSTKDKGQTDGYIIMAVGLHRVTSNYRVQVEMISKSKHQNNYHFIIYSFLWIHIQGISLGSIASLMLLMVPLNEVKAASTLAKLWVRVS